MDTLTGQFNCLLELNIVIKKLTMTLLHQYFKKVRCQFRIQLLRNMDTYYKRLKQRDRVQLNEAYCHLKTLILY
uniref:Uncharacterized protein n=1 Tax=Lepeophtheirus salmonis TaxID=72036 RepID=A0A0K2V0N4_LEPSM